MLPVYFSANWLMDGHISLDFLSISKPQEAKKKMYLKKSHVFFIKITLADLITNRQDSCAFLPFCLFQARNIRIMAEIFPISAALNLSEKI
jgi:hypothetical protein